jgi:putative FmdB family regulatory protein
VPTYAYACTECDHRFEVVQSFDDDALTVCPECGGRLRKVFNAVGIVFKGGGFYRTDSRSSGDGVRAVRRRRGREHGPGQGCGGGLVVLGRVVVHTLLGTCRVVHILGLSARA